MQFDPAGGDRLNSFAVVCYIHGPLAEFLDRLRQELVPQCSLSAHVTVLPPRPLHCAAAQAWRQLCSESPRFAPFPVELGGVEIFSHSDVIYIEVDEGRSHLRRMHEAFNHDQFSFQEPFAYHPHITLAQNLKPDQVDELGSAARRLWAEYRGPRSFPVEKLTFVQNTCWCGWLDLGEVALTESVPVRDPLPELR